MFSCCNGTAVDPGAGGGDGSIVPNAKPHQTASQPPLSSPDGNGSEIRPLPPLATSGVATPPESTSPASAIVAQRRNSQHIDRMLQAEKVRDAALIKIVAIGLHHRAGVGALMRQVLASYGGRNPHNSGGALAPDGLTPRLSERRAAQPAAATTNTAVATAAAALFGGARRIRTADIVFDALSAAATPNTDAAAASSSDDATGGAAIGGTALPGTTLAISNPARTIDASGGGGGSRTGFRFPVRIIVDYCFGDDEADGADSTAHHALGDTAGSPFPGSMSGLVRTTTAMHRRGVEEDDFEIDSMPMRLIRVHQGELDKPKWLPFCVDTTAIIFVAALDTYSQPISPPASSLDSKVPISLTVPPLNTIPSASAGGASSGAITLTPSAAAAAVAAAVTAAQPAAGAAATATATANSAGTPTSASTGTAAAPANDTATTPAAAASASTPVPTSAGTPAAGEAMSIATPTAAVGAGAASSVDLTQNVLRRSMDVFCSLINDRLLREKPIILFLTKKDLFAKQIAENPIPFGSYFPESKLTASVSASLRADAIRPRPTPSNWSGNNNPNDTPMCRAAIDYLLRAFDSRDHASPYFYETEPIYGGVTTANPMSGGIDDRPATPSTPSQSQVGGGGGGGGGGGAAARILGTGASKPAAGAATPDVESLAVHPTSRDRSRTLDVYVTSHTDVYAGTKLWDFTRGIVVRRSLTEASSVAGTPPSAANGSSAAASAAGSSAAPLRQSSGIAPGTAAGGAAGVGRGGAGGMRGRGGGRGGGGAGRGGGGGSGIGGRPTRFPASKPMPTIRSVEGDRPVRSSNTVKATNGAPQPAQPPATNSGGCVIA